MIQKIGIAGILLVAFIATVATYDEVWNGFTASWDRDTSTHFYTLPQTLEAAQKEGWSNIEGVNPAEGITALGFGGDPTFSLLLETDTVIGFQCAFPVGAVDPNQPLQWDELDVVTRKTLNNVEYFTATAYFYKNESMDTRRIWFQGKSGVVEIPTKASLVPLETEYLLKKCIPTMGIHYYTWHNTSDCRSLYPWLLLGDEENIIGVGFQGFGHMTNMGNRVWWETIPARAIYAAMDDPPPCAVSGAEEFGIFSLHVWFVDKPQNITCS